MLKFMYIRGGGGGGLMTTAPDIKKNSHYSEFKKKIKTNVLVNDTQ